MQRAASDHFADGAHEEQHMHHVLLASFLLVEQHIVRPFNLDGAN
jgi:hypothetical protein